MAVKVFLADDDPVVRAILSAIFETLGVDISMADSGNGCIQMITELAQANTLPDVILLDMQLQDLTGLEVLAKIRTIIGDAKKIPVVMLSSNTKQEILDLGPQELPDYFLEKPFTMQTVEDLLTNTLGFTL